MTVGIGRDEARAVGRELGHVPDARALRPTDARHGGQHARGGERVVQSLLGLPAARCRRGCASSPPTGSRAGCSARGRARGSPAPRRRAAGPSGAARRRAPGRGGRARTPPAPRPPPASTAKPARIARRLRARRRAAVSAAARASARNSRSPAVRARSVASAQASNWARRPSRGRYSGSRPESSHSSTASTSRRWSNRSSRRSSIHVRSRSHWPRIASWATSTVGVRVRGSRSNESSRCSP